MTDFSYSTSQLGLAMRKDFEYKNLINYQISKFKENGVLWKLGKKYKFGIAERACDNDRKEKGAPVVISTVALPIAIYIIGLITSISFFLCEICLKVYFNIALVSRLKYVK